MVIDDPQDWWKKFKQNYMDGLGEEFPKPEEGMLLGYLSISDELIEAEEDFLEFERILRDELLNALMAQVDYEMIEPEQFTPPPDPYTYREWLTFPQCMN